MRGVPSPFPASDLFVWLPLPLSRRTLNPPIEAREITSVLSLPLTETLASLVRKEMRHLALPFLVHFEGRTRASPACTSQCTLSGSKRPASHDRVISPRTKGPRWPFRNRRGESRPFLPRRSFLESPRILSSNSTWRHIIFFIIFSAVNFEQNTIIKRSYVLFHKQAFFSLSRHNEYFFLIIGNKYTLYIHNIYT